MRKLRPGDLVTVRGFREISSTLDHTDALDGLPFLLEMQKYCGRSFTVRRRVNKLIQEGVGASMRRIKNVVLLDGTICDGQAHGDCQRACFPLWKTAWLTAADKNPNIPDEKMTPIPHHAAAEKSQVADTTASGAVDGSAAAAILPRKGCQVTELMSATTSLPLWDPRRHYWDITSRTYKPREYVNYILGGIYRKTIKRIIGKMLKKKPALFPPPVLPESLDLKPGDLVEVKSAAEIQATLNSEGKSRSLYFMPGMWDYCGRRLRALQPIERMMSEKTGEMRALSQTVILEGVTCNGKAHGGCQRGCYVFWKDTWLRRVNESPQNPQA